MKKDRGDEVERLLREQDIIEALGVSRATFRRWVKDGVFPPSQTLEGRIQVWRSSVVVAWVTARIK